MKQRQVTRADCYAFCAPLYASGCFCERTGAQPCQMVIDAVWAGMTPEKERARIESNARTGRIMRPIGGSNRGLSE